MSFNDDKELERKIDALLFRVKKHGRKSLGRVVYGSTIMNVIFLLLQVLFIYLMIRRSVYSTGIVVAYIVLGIAVVLFIVNEEVDPMSKIAWIIPVVAIPIYGTFAYLFVRLQPRMARMRKHRGILRMNVKAYLNQEESVLRELRECSKDAYNTARYLGMRQEFLVYRNVHSEYFPSGEQMFRRMLLELAKAEKYIFIEYFIIERGIMWDAILEILKAKVAQGVEVRVLYDGTCSFSLLPANYPKQLEKCGIKVKVFSPIIPALSTHQNCRNHRKSMIIDGRIAFTGGINLADEYINEVERFGYWKDTGVMIEGISVHSMVGMFLQMWGLNHRKVQIEDLKDYFDEGLGVRPSADGGRDGYVIPYGNTPFDREYMGEQVYLDIINQAERYVYITTPYLILDDQLARALKTAAQRGVDVRIIMPHIPDKRYVFALSRSYYLELLRVGVHIYEYEPGFVHAKMFLSDDEKAVVGSINLDYRSLYLNFENAVYFYRVECIQNIQADFEGMFGQSIVVTEEMYRKFAIGSRMMGRVLRLIAPLM